ncbi:hypothetical protein Tco_0222472 [Tanacetum coccineum]
MATNEETNVVGTDTRPPMLVENDYESWKILTVFPDTSSTYSNQTSNCKWRNGNNVEMPLSRISSTLISKPTTSCQKDSPETDQSTRIVDTTGLCFTHTTSAPLLHHPQLLSSPTAQVHMIPEPIQKRKAQVNVGNTGARGKERVYVTTAEEKDMLASTDDNKQVFKPIMRMLKTTNVDEGPNAAIAFMANLSSTSAANSQVNEVHSNDNPNFDNVDYQLSQEMHQDEHLDSDAETEIDDNTIPMHQEFEQIFDDLETEYEQCVLDNKNLTIEKKNLLIKNDCLIAECLEKDICSIVLTSDIVVPPSSNCLCEDLKSHCDREHTKVLELEAEISKQKQKVVVTQQALDTDRIQLKDNDYLPQDSQKALRVKDSRSKDETPQVIAEVYEGRHHEPLMQLANLTHDYDDSWKTPGESNDRLFRYLRCSDTSGCFRSHLVSITFCPGTQRMPIWVHHPSIVISEGGPAVTENLLPHQIPLPDTSDSDVETLFDHVDSHVFDTHNAPETDSEALIPL